MIVVRDACPSDIDAIAPRMRAADAAEVWAWAGLAPRAALARSLARSPVSWCADLNGRPMCLFGVAGSLLGATGEPWALGADDVAAEPLAFLRQSRRVTGWMLDLFPRLANWTDARHRASHGWLRWLGFRLGAARPAGVLGLPFLPFEMERPS